MESRDIIFNKYDNDKNVSFHNYTRQYNKLLHLLTIQTPLYKNQRLNC